MKIAVLGASGRTGREVIRCALDGGHHITAVVRDPARFQPTDRQAIIAVADVHDQAAVNAAMQGWSGRIHPRRPTPPPDNGVLARHRGARTRMRGAGARRLICLSAGALNLGPHIPLGQRMVSRAVVRLFFRDGYTDMAKMEAALHHSELLWTVVRVPGLTDKPPTGAYRVAEPPLPRPSTIPRGDLAAYLVSILGDRSTRRSSRSADDRGPMDRHRAEGPAARSHRRRSRRPALARWWIDCKPEALSPGFRRGRCGRGCGPRAEDRPAAVQHGAAKDYL